HVERWTDLEMGESAVFLLERDPEVPEAFRPVGAGGVFPVVDEVARICHEDDSSACNMEMIPISELRDLIETPSQFEHEQNLDEGLEDLMHDQDLQGEEIDPSLLEAPAEDLLDVPLEEGGQDDLELAEQEIIEVGFVDLYD
ncbi:MAG: hypothetical protein ACOCVR_04560, partial [Myxococcota bacterium]